MLCGMLISAWLPFWIAVLHEMCHSTHQPSKAGSYLSMGIFDSMMIASSSTYGMHGIYFNFLAADSPRQPPVFAGDLLVTNCKRTLHSVAEVWTRPFIDPEEQVSSVRA
jgi:hypothetical protein